MRKNPEIMTLEERNSFKCRFVVFVAKLMNVKINELCCRQHYPNPAPREYVGEDAYLKGEGFNK
jgi:hypothetical protein